MKKHKVIAIVGPTSSGKSALGIYLAKRVHGEIVSADSRQIYKGLNLTSGKLSRKEQSGIPHYLLDVASPKRNFNASEYVKKAELAIEKIYTHNAIPIVVGGTGLYIDALLGRIVLPNVPPNKSLRARLEKKSIEEIYRLLKKKDPRRAQTIEPRHKRRLIRALEIAAKLGKNPMPATIQKYDVLWLGLRLSDKILHKKIHNRLIARMKQGMLREAKLLHGQGLTYHRMEELGLELKLLAYLLQHKISKKEFMQSLERAIMQYAKRQDRWFNRNRDIVWIENKSEAIKKVAVFLSVPLSTI